MAKKNDELLKRLHATFRIEADEHLKAISSGLLALEKFPGGTEAASIIETIYREAHSLKGAARAVSFPAVESLCRSLESVFAELKHGRLTVSLPLLDQLHRANDGLDALLSGENGAEPTLPPLLADLITQLDQAAAGMPPTLVASTAPPAEPAITAAPTAAIAAAPEAASARDAVLRQPPASTLKVAETVRVATAKLDTVLRQVEELLSPKLAVQQRSLELRDTAASVAAWKKARMQIQPALRRIENAVLRTNSGNGTLQRHLGIMKVLDYLDGERHLIATIEDRLNRLSKATARDRHTLSSMSDSLLQDVKEMQLLPFATLFDDLPRVARELARDQGKEVALTVQGSEIEIDRRVLELLKDPLIHMLRNAIDHGIEPAPLRIACGKPAQGAITLAVTQRDSGKVEILFADDGAGIDATRVVAAADKQGIYAAGADADAQTQAREALDLVFQSGVSTSPIITDVSGHGLGLAIVREKVEQLGGHIALESTAGNGTAFYLVLPLSLATLRGVLVRIGARLCVIPAAGIERVARVSARAISTVENRDTIVLDGQVVSLAALSDVLDMPRAPIGDANEFAPVIVLGQREKRIAFRVDEILGEQEILIKNLGPQLARVRNVAGACVLGSGQMAPVLNTVDLLKSAVTHVAAPMAAVDDAAAATGARQAILVAEDSITSRSLIKSILESAGYAVTTAVDGMDAFTELKSADYDLLVSDVEMPRMDGFDLTARVRADKRLGELPVVLITALESREHRERGIDVGANAYIVKSSFDQSNLLEIITRLL